MKKIDEGIFSLEGSKDTYFVRLFEKTYHKAYVVRVYDKYGVFKKQISEKYFFTIVPDFHSMVHSALVDIELLETHKRDSLKKLLAHKMRTDIMWAVVLIDKDGGQSMKRCSTESEANSESEKLVTLIKESKRKGFKVYISQLEYDKDKNDLLVDSKLVDEYSELMFSN